MVYWTLNLLFHLVQLWYIYFLHLFMHFLEQLLLQSLPQLLFSQPSYRTVRLCFSVCYFLTLILCFTSLHLFLLPFFCFFLHHFIQPFHVFNSDFLVDQFLSYDLPVKHFENFVRVKFQVDIMGNHHKGYLVLHVQLYQDVKHNVRVSRVQITSWLIEQ